MTAKGKLTVTLFVALAVLAGSMAYLPTLAGKVAYAQQAAQAKAARDQLADLAKEDHISQLFRAVAKAVKPAVVEVRVSKRIQVAPMPEMEDFLRRFFGDSDPFGGEITPQVPRQPPQPREFLQRGLGSGVIVDAREGYVLTNYHVVAGADEVTVVLSDGRRLETEWIRSDPQTDLAVLRVNDDRLIDAPLGDSDAMEVGDLVLAIGSPEGLPQTVTAGIISALGRTTGRGGYENFLQTDASINRGNSGGPLVNTKGEVIGINTAIVSRSGVNEGIGFAIPSNMARNVMRQLIDKGKVVRGFLGIGFQDVDERLARSFDIPTTRGTLVRQVSEGGPADKAGLQAGDFIIRVGEQRIANGNELRNAVAGMQPGQKVEVEFYREGKTRKVTVTLAQQPAEVAAAGGEGSEAPEGSAQRSFGLSVTDLTDRIRNLLDLGEDVKGVAITDVQQGSDAAEQGIGPGMVVTHVDGKAVTSAKAFAEALEKRKTPAGVRLRVVDRRGQAQFVFITPQTAPPNRE